MAPLGPAEQELIVERILEAKARPYAWMDVNNVTCSNDQTAQTYLGFLLVLLSLAEWSMPAPRGPS